MFTFICRDFNLQSSQYQLIPSSSPLNNPVCAPDPAFDFVEYKKSVSISSEQSGHVFYWLLWGLVLLLSWELLYIFSDCILRSSHSINSKHGDVVLYDSEDHCGLVAVVRVNDQFSCVSSRSTDRQFSIIQSVILEMKGNRSWCVEARGPSGSLPHCYHSGVNDKAARDILFPIWALFGSSLFRSTEKSPAKDEGSLYGHGSTRPKPPGAQAGRHMWRGEDVGEGWSRSPWEWGLYVGVGVLDGFVTETCFSKKVLCIALVICMEQLQVFTVSGLRRAHWERKSTLTLKEIAG